MPNTSHRERRVPYLWYTCFMVLTNSFFYGLTREPSNFQCGLNNKNRLSDLFDCPDHRHRYAGIAHHGSHILCTKNALSSHHNKSFFFLKKMLSLYQVKYDAKQSYLKYSVTMRFQGHLLFTIWQV